MPTPRFRDLDPQQSLEVIDAFLGADSKVSFTEKLAGQNLVAIVTPTGDVLTTSKSVGRIASGMFPEVTGPLEKFHPPVETNTKYTFEIIRSAKRPDFIDYKIDTPYVAVEFSGAMTKDVEQQLNSRQKDVKFYTSDDIKKSVKGVLGPEQKTYLQFIRDKIAVGAKLTPQEKSETEDVLMSALDSGAFPSSIGGQRIEGLFGTTASGGFKIPSKKYAEIQRMQAGLYGAVKNEGKKEFSLRFQEEKAGDRLVADVLKYLEKVAGTQQTPGFRFFFSPVEAKELLSGDIKELGKKFYDRVKSKDWVSSQQVDPQIKLENKNTYNTRRLLREFIRGLLAFPQVR